jgi:hypothetical protein
MSKSLALWLIVLAFLLASKSARSADTNASKQHLAAMQQLVGSWHGVGQPQRGSSKDSWVEEAEWAWSFGDEGPALVAELPKRKYFQRLRLTAEENPGYYRLTAWAAVGGAPREKIVYAGRLDDQQQLVLNAEQPQQDLPQRLSFRFVADGKRLLILMEKGGTTAGQFTRLAEVGYTRQGSGFGKGTVQRECIVTGGLGTIAVTHNGRTYYVCCTGCRDYFKEQPDLVLAEYSARKEAEKK